MKKYMMSGYVSRMGEMRNEYRILVGGSR